MTAQPSGAATPRDSDAHERIAVPKAFCVLRERPPAKTQKRPSSPFYTLATQSFRNVRNAPRVVIPPLASHTRKGPERRVKKQQHHQVANRSRSPAGPRRLGTATRISASLSRRLSAFFGSTLDQTLKAAKFAVLPPGHAGFPKRVERSEGSDTTPTSHVQKVLRTE